MFQNDKGFNFIEVIIAIVIISIIAVGLSSLFSVVLDTPIITNKRKAYMYAQKEMESLFNKNYDDIVSISRTNYPDDEDFDYEIEVNELNPGLKSVRVNFYPEGDSLKIAELYTLFVKTGFSICDDFEENGDNSPPWDWNHTNGWEVVGDPTTPSNRIYRYRGAEEGYAYPSSFSGSNYKASCKFFLRTPSSIHFISFSKIYLGIRVDPSTGYGYYVRILALIRSFGWFKWVIYRPYLVKVDSHGETPLYRLPLSIEFISGNYTEIHEIGINAEGNNISFHFDSNTGNASDSEFSSGNIMLKGDNDRTVIYFDDVCVEGE